MAKSVKLKEMVVSLNNKLSLNVLRNGFFGLFRQNGAEIMTKYLRS